MEQQLDAFTQKRFELMIDMATKKLQQEITSLKEHIVSMSSEISSLKSQVSRIQFQPQQSQPIQRTLVEPQKKVQIIDCRPEGEKREDFKSGAEKNAEPVKPRYGDYQPEDVSIDKFFYFGRK